MATDTKPPTRMGKAELKDKLISLGYSEDQLLDSGGKGLKRPGLLDMLKSHEQGEQGLAVLSNATEDEND